MESHISDDFRKTQIVKFTQLGLDINDLDQDKIILLYILQYIFK
ncbi:hypothetical protein RMAECT_1430 [Rickettsia rhipicephali str. Ect]|uniref:Uncharacterized protein n=1 Tax=Rickettsia rhipicephali str. Ect TaxID=1359199 RepID=A0A0F3PFK3_RICRH|nr:hypothetical protein RMAECT_1430 [Rickettsia rhipicephali str. Ect]